MQLCRLAPLAIAALAVAPLSASAYTVKTSSTGAPVHWSATTVEFVPALVPGPATVSTAAATAVIDTSAATWRTALAGTDVTAEMSDTTATAAPHTNDGVNTVRWALDAEDPDIEKGILALTYVAYRTSDGAIADADVVLNASDFVWTSDTAGCSSRYDLQSALTHEMGHAFGLAHSAGHPEATMYATGGPCETLKRDLADDDKAGLADLYPQSSGSAAGCSTSPGSGSWAMVVAIAGMLLIARKRRAAVAAAMLGTLGLAGHAEASQLRRLEVAELAQDAVMVVRGHLISAAALPGDAIETDSEIAVDECLSGRCPATVHVVRRGGERDGVGLWVDSEAEPSGGDDVVLYLRSDARGRLRVLGGVQGLWRVVATAQGTLAVRDLRGQHVLIDGAWQAGELEAIALDRLVRSLPRPAVQTR